MRAFASCLSIRVDREKFLMAWMFVGCLLLTWLLMFDTATAAESNLPDRTIVPGFDRFYAAAEDGSPANSKSSEVRGGLMLLGELNCTSCHQASDTVMQQISLKQAPLLGEVGSRVNPDWFTKFLADPQACKPGTTMPDVLGGLSVEEKQATIEQLTHFLASQATHPFIISGPDNVAVRQGEKLFHTAGCVACHAPQQKQIKELLATSVPLGKLDEKYSISSLTAFLKDPLHVRPSGRMPLLPLEENDASLIAQYLLRDVKAPAALNVAYYEGKLNKLEDFEKPKPKSTGSASSFDVSQPPRKNDFAYQFTGFLLIEKEGEYTFYTKSDDGSWLLVDDKLVVDNGGIHASQEKSGKIKLSPGRYPIRVAYQQGGGEYSLDVQYEGPGFKRRNIPSALLTSTFDPPPEQKKFVVDKELAKAGKLVFGKLGCAACHQLGMKQEEIVSAIKAPDLDKLKSSGGCLSAQTASGRPQFRLSAAQVKALSAALSAINAKKLPSWEVADRVHAKFTSLNCYACHLRGKIGGVTNSRNEFFTATDKDLGDEGRLPPLLTGVGDKLQSKWLGEVLTAGAVARPYMNAKMPQFGEKNLTQLAEDLTKVDLTEPSAPVSPVKVDVARKAGHRLVGKNGLSCISCHMFYRHKSTGIQATDLSMMPQRLRADWFYRYMQNPQLYRPGTRMPQAWPQGKSLRREILEGNTDDQISAIYTYLTAGRRAKLPDGVVVTSMELIVGGEALMYRGFIEKAGSRAIGVGYPEEVNLAFDADELRLALLWQGRFLDASLHWAGRGQGFIKPLGNKVVELNSGPPLAELESETTPWPTETGHAAGYQFKGYQLDEVRRPTFMYQFGDVAVTDYLVPAEYKEGADKRLVRTLSFAADKTPETLWFRVAKGSKIEKINETTFRVDGNLTVKIQSLPEAVPLLREVGGNELLVPVKFKDGKSQVVIEYDW